QPLNSWRLWLKMMIARKKIPPQWHRQKSISGNEKPKNRPPKPLTIPAREESAAEWLKLNWLTYILTPLIIVVFVGGCI
ncbi:hypothetical protein PENTCL1PPCAC_4069, partial [Pristionchus entomophagus]